MFVITADHTQKNILPEFDNELGHFRVPLILYHPKVKWPKLDLDMPVQHIDILPSVLDFLGVENKFKILLAESVFKTTADKTVLLFNDNLYYQVGRQFVSVWDKHGEIRHYNVDDLRLAKPLDLTPEVKQSLEKKLRASIQYFNQGMWDNRLYFPSK